MSRNNCWGSPHRVGLDPPNASDETSQNSSVAPGHANIRRTEETLRSFEGRWGFAKWIWPVGFAPPLREQRSSTPGHPQVRSNEHTLRLSRREPFLVCVCLPATMMSGALDSEPGKSSGVQGRTEATEGLDRLA